MARGLQLAPHRLTAATFSCTEILPRIPYVRMPCLGEISKQPCTSVLPQTVTPRDMSEGLLRCRRTTYSAARALSDGGSGNSLEDAPLLTSDSEESEESGLELSSGSSDETDASDVDDANIRAMAPEGFSSPSSTSTSSTPPATVQPSRLKKLKGSMRLRKWASIRRKTRTETEEDQRTGPNSRFDSMIGREEDYGNGMGDGENDEENSAKEIYIISDGTGWTADNAVQAALGQFDYCFVDGGCPVKTRMYPQIRSVEKLLEILRMAGENRALVVSTLVEASMNDVAKTACRVMRIPHVDMMDPLLARVEEHLGVTAQRLPRGSPGRKKNPLSKEYFRRIEAVDFTIKQDDGAHPRNLHKADIVLIGVSRTGKTPLSIYLAQKGYKVANVPLVVGVAPPADLFTMNQNKIYALTIDPYTLEAIRRSRYATLGLIPEEGEEGSKSSTQNQDRDSGLQSPVGSLEERILARRFEEDRGTPGTPSGSRLFGGALKGNESGGSYYSLGSIRAELEQMHQLFRANPSWPVIDVTGKAVEETAARILSIRYERIHRNKMPYITRRY